MKVAKDLSAQSEDDERQNSLLQTVGPRNDIKLHLSQLVSIHLRHPEPVQRKRSQCVANVAPEILTASA
jgi:hypothetical protein